MENFFKIVNVTFSSSKNHQLNNINLDIKNKGDVICFLGPSGVGKTTILRTIAGLEKISSGEIWLDNKLLSSGKHHTAPEDRKVALSFQDNCLFPHLNLKENIEIGIKSKKNLKKNEISFLIKTFKLQNLLEKFPHQISAGESQRVSLARTLLSNPKLLLLDEPFSNIDPGLKEELQMNLKKILNEKKLTTILVTHDYNEAFYFGNKCGLFIKNNLEQFDSPYQIYHYPKSEKVANFFNKGVFIKVRVVSRFAVKHHILGTISGNFVEQKKIGSLVRLLIQPEDLIHDDKSKLKFKIIDKKFIGTNFIYHLRLPKNEIVPVLVHAHHSHLHDVNDEFGVKFPINIDHLVCF